MQASPRPDTSAAMARRLAELEEERKKKADRVEELSNMCDHLGQARYEADVEHEKALKDKDEELRKTTRALKKAVESVRSHKSDTAGLHDQIKAIENDRNNCVEALNQLHRDLQEAHQEIARRGPPSPDSQAEGQVSSDPKINQRRLLTSL